MKVVFAPLHTNAHAGSKQQCPNLYIPRLPPQVFLPEGSYTWYYVHGTVQSYTRTANPQWRNTKG